MGIIHHENRGGRLIRLPGSREDPRSHGSSAVIRRESLMVVSEKTPKMLQMDNRNAFLT